jgi:hypothetical protein
MVGTSAVDVWSLPAGADPIVWHWDGRWWWEIPLERASSFIAIADGQRPWLLRTASPFLAHHDGTAWVDLWPSTLGDIAPLEPASMAAVPGGGVWLVGVRDGVHGLLHYDGASWEWVEVARALAVAADGSDVWVAWSGGGGVEVGRRVSGVIEPVALLVGAREDSVLDLLPRAQDDVWLSDALQVFHWDGERTVAMAPPRLARRGALLAFGDDMVSIDTGYACIHPGHTRAYRWDGADWLPWDDGVGAIFGPFASASLEVRAIGPDLWLFSSASYGC